MTATRYIIEPLRSDGTPRMGSLGRAVRSYANDRNARRGFARLLRNAHFGPGQYQLSTWPADPFEPQRIVGPLYKLAET